VCLTSGTWFGMGRWMISSLEWEVPGGICSTNIDDFAHALPASSQVARNVTRPLWPILLVMMILLWPIDVLLRKL
jgi:hypothetical protein